MRIGELAKAAHCSVETIRYYEQQQLLPKPERNQSNYRCYNKNHLSRLKFIRNCRSLDLTHEEIHKLLKLIAAPNSNCSDISELLDEHIEHVTTRIDELQNLQQQLMSLQHHCHQYTSAKECSIVQELTDMKIEINPHKSHV